MLHNNSELNLFWENDKLLRYSNFNSPNFKDCYEVRSADPSISLYFWILRIGGPANSLLNQIFAEMIAWFHTILTSKIDFIHLSFQHYRT